MKISNLFVAAIASLGFASIASAQPGTCSEPVDIFSDSTVSGNLCAMPNSLSACGTNCGLQPDFVYKFEADNANATIKLSHGGNMTGVVFLIPVTGGDYCNTANDPIALGFDGYDMDVDSLTNGSEYLVLVTADPDGPEDACDDFTVVVNGRLPVELQSFSVD